MTTFDFDTIAAALQAAASLPHQAEVTLRGERLGTVLNGKLYICPRQS